MKYLEYLKPEVLYAMVKASGQNFLSLGFGRNGNSVGICIVDSAVGKSFVVPALESCDGNFKPSLLETWMKENALKEIKLNVATLHGGLQKLISEGRSSSLKELIVSDLIRFGDLSWKLGSLLEVFGRQERIFKNMVLRRDSSVIHGDFNGGMFVLDRLIPLQTLKLNEMSVEGVRNVLNKLISIHNVGGLLLSFDQKYWRHIKRYKYMEECIKMLDLDGKLKETRFTFVDEEKAWKKVENDISVLYPELRTVDNLLQKYPCVGQHGDLKALGIDLTKYRDGLRNCYAASFFSALFYRMVSKNKLERNKRNLRKQQKLVKYAGSLGYLTNVNS